MGYFYLFFIHLKMKLFFNQLLILILLFIFVPVNSVSLKQKKNLYNREKRGCKQICDEGFRHMGLTKCVGECIDENCYKEIVDQNLEPGEIDTRIQRFEMCARDSLVERKLRKKQDIT